MSLNTKRIVVFILGVALCVALIIVAEMETRKHLPPEDMPLSTFLSMTPEGSRECVSCHTESSPGIVAHWRRSTHARSGVACVECHEADEADADSFRHYGAVIATVVTPLDCSRCHKDIADEFAGSHHAAGGNILASLDNFLAETVEGARQPFNPHSPTPGRQVDKVNGLASAFSGCQQCHGSKVALQTKDGGMVTVDDLKPDESGKPTNKEAAAKVVRDEKDGRPLYHKGTWPNTGIGRLNLDGSRGSCSACHSRHDFSPRRARQPENCGKCHLGPDHPQKEIYEESKHGVAYRDLKDKMNLDAATWILGKDYSEAPTCATCHMSANTRNKGKITHDPGKRISWTNRPDGQSACMDTDASEGKLIKEQDPVERKKLLHAIDKDGKPIRRCREGRTLAGQAPTDEASLYCIAIRRSYVNGLLQASTTTWSFINYNEKFAKPGKKIMTALLKAGLRSRSLPFDDKIEWTWFYLWHHEGRRARHGASMMAPDYTHWHGMYEVAERFYEELIPEARELADHAAAAGNAKQAKAIHDVINGILSRPEHVWNEASKKKPAHAPKPPATQPAKK